jgi:hypothetical protein
VLHGSKQTFRGPAEAGTDARCRCRTRSRHFWQWKGDALVLSRMATPELRVASSTHRQPVAATASSSAVSVGQQHNPVQSTRSRIELHTTVASSRIPLRRPPVRPSLWVFSQRAHLHSHCSRLAAGPGHYGHHSLRLLPLFAPHRPCHCPEPCCTCSTWLRCPTTTTRCASRPACVA